MRGYCGLEVSSWFVWLAARKESAWELCRLKGEGRGLPWAVALFFQRRVCSWLA
ncbi:hypothetical protein NC652_016945 [Populus alba x Populus x berolinensis]|nr:hypothetical protein NC652_016945 [Populus alba x Populus x berolinensis]